MSEIVYDQPLNEMIRVSLRLEQFFQQIDHSLHDSSTMGTRNLISLIINVLNLLDRPDLKTKLAKELGILTSTLLRYKDMLEIDGNKLSKITSQLENLSRSLISSNGKIGHRLREVELINTLRLHLATPGGGCSFDIPLYHYWLAQPVTVRQDIINNWLEDFSEIKQITTLLLDLVRSNAKIEQKVAIHGFHQELLDPQSNLRMIRVGLGNNLAAHPEISIGRHFLSIRFYFPEIEKKSSQYTHNLPFWIAYCNI